MSTPASVITQLQNDVALVNSVTGEADTNLHDAIAHLLAASGGTASAGINGSAFDCGMFLLASNETTFAVSHQLGASPSAVFLWSVNAPFTTSGIIHGQMRFNTVLSATASATAINGFPSTLNGYAINDTRMSWTNNTITFKTKDNYPFCAGLTYQWLAIA